MVPAVRTALLLFAFGLTLRLCFWLGADDASAAWHVGLQGDAPLWQELAHKLHTGTPDEQLQLPLRPPGMLWLVAALWHGEPGTAFGMRLLFATLGALLAPLLFLLLARHLAHAEATLAGGLCAAASPLLLLSSGLHSELPYLLLLLVSMFDQEKLRNTPTAFAALRWGVLHALLILLRAEHSLTFVALLTVLALQRAPQLRRTAGLALGAAFLTLLPWQLRAAALVATYNTANPPALPPAGVAAPGGLPWQEQALQRLRELPTFQQGPVFGFVQDTVRVRGGTQVTAPDLDVITQAYDCWPQPLPTPFVCLYGGLNFFLANTPEADGGFSNAALDRQPPLSGGDALYPPGLRRVLPRGGQLALGYPPHLHALLHGYRLGVHELANDPLGGAIRITKKLHRAAAGALPGLGGYALPIALSGVRAPVDLVVATGWWPQVWRALVAIAAAFGLWRLRKAPWVWPWFAFAISKSIVIAAFFGYARQGALLVPVVALGLAACLPRPPRLRTLLFAGCALVALEAWRTFTVEAFVDGLPAANAATDHLPHTLEYR